MAYAYYDVQGEKKEALCNHERLARAFACCNVRGVGDVCGGKALCTIADGWIRYASVLRTSL